MRGDNHNFRDPMGEGWSRNQRLALDALFTLAAERAMIERRERELVALARRLNISWRTIAAALDMSKSTIRGRYGDDAQPRQRRQFRKRPRTRMVST